ncbi:MAG: tetratricopeptide repeat protein, partial [Planctomycetales bacterium]|nr:tetratricopeptide repeat protein [Planctomycetales bacterium]
MDPDRRAAESAQPRGLAPLTPASRQRLQKVFEHGQRCAEKKDYDYANQLFTQCVAEDPASLVYLQSFFANLQQKYGDNKKGAKLAGLKIKSHRSAVNRAAGKGNWEAAVQAGCAALALNPWDIPSLLAVASVCEELRLDECRLFFLRQAMAGDAKHVEVNRQAALTLERMGQFDQAIACWRRVDQAQPQDEEARKAIARLSVEKTIHEGGYDSGLLSANPTDSDEPNLSVARLSKAGGSEDVDENTDSAHQNLSPEARVIAAIRSDPANLEHYIQLADICIHESRFIDAEDVLGRGLSVSGGGDLRFREKLEDVQVRRAQYQLAVAEQRHSQAPTEEAERLITQLRNQANQVELEVYAARSGREPGNPRLQYELGLRLKRAGKPKDAIPALEAAKADPKRRGIVLLELG